MLSKRRITVLEKLALSGADTEKKISSLTAEDIYNVMMSQGLKVSDMRDVLDLQKAIKEKKIIPFFTRGKDEEIKKDEDNRDTRTDDTGDYKETSTGYAGWNRDQY